VWRPGSRRRPQRSIERTESSSRSAGRAEESGTNPESPRSQRDSIEERPPPALSNTGDGTRNHRNSKEQAPESDGQRRGRIYQTHKRPGPRKAQDGSRRVPAPGAQGAPGARECTGGRPSDVQRSLSARPCSSPHKRLRYQCFRRSSVLAIRPSRFEHSRWLNPHVQTLAGKFLRRPADFPLVRERWARRMGTFWTWNSRAISCRIPVPERPHARSTQRHDRRLLLHGLEGHTGAGLHAGGDGGPHPVWASQPWHSTSAPAPVRSTACPASTTPARQGDPRWVIETLRARFPKRPVGRARVLVGRQCSPSAVCRIAQPCGCSRGHLCPLRSRRRNCPLSGGTMGGLYTRYFLRIRSRERCKPREQLLSTHIDVDRGASI
jgi:hypothetical protein